MSELTDEIADKINESHYDSIAHVGRDMIRLIAEVGGLEAEVATLKEASAWLEQKLDEVEEKPDPAGVVTIGSLSEQLLAIAAALKHFDGIHAQGFRDGVFAENLRCAQICHRKGLGWIAQELQRKGGG